MTDAKNINFFLADSKNYSIIAYSYFRIAKEFAFKRIAKQVGRAAKSHAYNFC